MGGKKSSKIETEKRVFTIHGWILSGVPDYLILKNIEQSDWNVGRRQAKNLLKKAYEIWHQQEIASVEEKRAMKIAQHEQAIRNMKPEFKNTPKGMAVTLAIQKEITKLQALYPATRHILEGDPEKPLIFSTVDDREARIAELMKKLK